MSEKEVRIPRQQRSLEKKKRIKKAAIDLFGEKGMANTSTNEIAKKAGISIGTLYSYYEDKKAIYTDLLDDHMSIFLDNIKTSEIREDMNPKDMIKMFVSQCINSHAMLENFGIEMTCMAFRYTEYRELEEKYRLLVRQKIYEILEIYKKDLRITDTRAACFVIQDSAENIIHEIAFFESYKKEGLTREDMLDNFADMVCHYLFTPQALEQMGCSYSSGN